MKTALRLVVLFVAVFGFTTASHAVPITYTFAGITTGHLGLSAFEEALVVVTATADTSNVQVNGADSDGDGIDDLHFYSNLLDLTTVTIAGLGTVTVLDPTVILAFPPIPNPDPGEELFMKPVVALGTIDSPSDLDFTGLAGIGSDLLLGYNLKMPMVPILDTGVVGYPPSLFVHTSGGNLSFWSNAVDIDTRSKFMAVAPVPEPTSVSLLGSGIVLLAGLTRFRKRA
jgi:hypothetical protein